MIPRGVKIAHVVILLFSALLAFLVLRAIDEEVILGASARIEITRSDNSVSSKRVVGMLESFADEHNVNIGNEAADLNNPENRRHLYLAVGNPDDPSASWLVEGYPGFSRDMHTDVQPLSTISRLDPRGWYVVFGPPHVARELIAEFEKLGFSGELAPNPNVSNTISWFASNDSLLWCFLIVLLAAVMVIGASVVLNAKTYGVLRLQGKSFAQILGRDMAQLGAFWVRAAVLVVAGVVACLAVYNGLNRLWLFGLIAAGLLAVLTTVALAAHVLALGLTYRTKIMLALKGEVSATLAMAGVYVIRILAALLALAIVTSAFSTAQEVAARQASREAFAKVGDASTLMLWGNPEVEKELNRTVGPFIRRSESRGDVVLALHMDTSDIFPTTGHVPERDVLLVNNEYLAEQTVLDAAGRRLHGVRSPGYKAQILLPESLSGEADRFTAPITDWLKFQAKLSGEELNAAQVQTLKTRSDQTVFTYGSGIGTDLQTKALIRDPIIVVVPGSSGIFGDSQYVAYASQNGVIFKDPDDVRAAMSTGVGRFVIAMSPVAREAAKEYQDLIREFRLALFNTTAALTVLLISAASAALIYRRKNAQSLFVKYINGWPFAKAHLSLLILEATLALALIGWVLWTTVSHLLTERELTAQYRAEGIPPPPVENVPLADWQPAVMLAVVVAGFLTTILVLALSQGVMIRRQAIEE